MAESRIKQLFSDWAAASDKDNRAVTRPYIIAEAGVNHEGSMETARRLIDLAAEGGADAIKFQTYKAATLASKNSPAYWDLSQEPTTSQFELFQKHDSFWKDEYEQLKTHCDNVGIEFLSTPFDAVSAEFLNDLMPAFKISSSDITNKPFVQQIAAYGKPIILSTGASDLAEISRAKSWIDELNAELALLHCVLNYPTPDGNAHLGMINGLQKAFPGTIIGYSDHTFPLDMETCLIATAMGSRIIEKHFSQDKTLPGNDHYHAMDVTDLRHFNDRLDRLFTLMGRSELVNLPEEDAARLNARRSLVAARPIPAGSLIGSDDLIPKRPAHGISPADIDDVVGRVTRRDIAEDELLSWDMLA